MGERYLLPAMLTVLDRCPRLISCGIACLVWAIAAEPVVLTGAMLQPLLGTRIADLRVTDAAGAAIPFQVDEVTPDGEYVCPAGKSPNTDSGNGLLDKQDEVVFLWEDAGSGAAAPGARGLRVEIHHEAGSRSVWVRADSALPLSSRSYISYDGAAEKITTPFYYAVFGHDRFHFTRAGTMDFGTGTYRDLANELRIRVVATMLWGLIPLRFTEESIFCFVKRYKDGPVRLIRRGDFHLNIGLGIKGGRAGVNQVCYPQVVHVPVRVKLPIRLKALFSDAYIEMGPVISAAYQDYRLNVPRFNISNSFSPKWPPCDTLLPIVPEGVFFRVDDGKSGFGWLLQSTMQRSLMEGSGFIFARYAKGPAAGHAGFRLSLRDLARGEYVIANWVTFSQAGLADLEDNIESVENPARIRIAGQERTYVNAIAAR